MTIKNGIGNAYNTTKTSGKNIVGGTYIGGNFWGKPDGTGFSNKAVDSDGDGIADVAYKNISSSIYSDYLPLVTPSKLAVPEAGFSSNVTSGNIPLSVSFTDASTGTVTAWNWTFGDGTYSIEKNPIHLYSKAGNYTVKMTASNSAGNNTTTKTNYIKAITPNPPAAFFWGTPLSGNAPLNVTFKDTSTGSPTAWNWSFGDGTYSTEQNPVHTYKAAGIYTVKMTASNVAGNSTKIKNSYVNVTGTSSTKLAAIASSSNASSESSNVTSENSNATSENTSQTPVASFSSNITSGSAPLNVLFNDTSTGSPTTWSWSFGDGNSSTVQKPVHTYSAAGNYTVTLTVGNVAGNNTITKSNYITVTGTSSTTKPVAAFSASPTSGNSPLNVSFTDSSTGSPTSWSWNFGDGNSSTQKNPTHTYSTAGNYTVALTVNNTAGSNTVTKSNYITVTEASSAKLAASSNNVTSENTSLKPVAAFLASPTSGKAPLNVTFTDSSTGSPTAWNWSFGDGNSSTEKNPKHTYFTTGNYTVALTVKNTAGSNTSTKNNYIVVSKP